MSHVKAWSPSRATSLTNTMWRGRSGRSYMLSQENLDRFHLEGSTLYILAFEGTALWVGSAHDVIEDCASRDRFKMAIRKCSEVYRNDTLLDESARQQMTWDLENGQRADYLRLVEAS